MIKAPFGFLNIPSGIPNKPEIYQAFPQTIVNISYKFLKILF